MSAARTRTITQRVRIHAAPRAVYDALVNARTLAAATGSAATGAARVGCRFTAWDGYIMGVHKTLVPGKRIVQEWTTTEWPADAAPSRLEVTLKVAKDGTELRMVHSNVPATQAGAYRQGWIDYYWTPLQEYFSKKGRT